MGSGREPCQNTTGRFVRQCGPCTGHSWWACGARVSVGHTE